MPARHVPLRGSPVRLKIPTYPGRSENWVHPETRSLARCRTVFDRFTKRARQVIVIAQDESRSLGHCYIGSEHLLIGLLRVPEGLAARVLEPLGITLEKVRGEVIQVTGPGREVGGTGQIPFTPAAKMALELSLQEALLLGHNYIGTEHILLGLVRANEGVAARIMLDANLDAENVRREVIQAVSRSGPADASASELDDVELTSPPLASELIHELARLAVERQALIDAKKLEEAAFLVTRELRLRRPAAALVREWHLHRGRHKPETG